VRGVAIDLNCDMGESFGAWTMGQDEAVLPFVTSANVACGFHAGDPQVMLATVRAAVRHGVKVGAHVALPDLQGFGRREMKVTPDEAHAFTLYQLGALDGVARACGAKLAHVKPHGALYNMAARDPALSAAIATAVAAFDRGLVLFGLAGGALVVAGRAAGLRVAEEAFADRSYEPDGQLTPRGIAGAVLSDPAAAAAQAVALATRGEVIARGGATVTLRADTICVHGDRVDAAAFARALREALAAAGLRVEAP
jgi:UPF0271 protein